MIFALIFISFSRMCHVKKKSIYTWSHRIFYTQFWSVNIRICLFLCRLALSLLLSKQKFQVHLTIDRLFVAIVVIIFSCIFQLHRLPLEFFNLFILFAARIINAFLDYFCYDNDSAAEDDDDQIICAITSKRSAENNRTLTTISTALYNTRQWLYIKIL